MKTELTIISDDLNHGIIDEKKARTLLLDLLGVSKSVKIALLQQLEDLSDHLPCEVYTKKVIEVKSNFNNG